MLRLSLCNLTWILFRVSPVPAQIPDSAFRWAFSVDSLIYLQSPVAVDWPVIAGLGRPDFQATHPDTSLIRDSYHALDGFSFIHFKGPLPAAVPRDHYWILADSGAIQVHPHGVSGAIVIRTSPVGWPVLDLYYIGNLVAPLRADDHIGEPNFTVFSTVPIHILSTPAPIGDSTAPRTASVIVGARRIEFWLTTRRHRPSRARTIDVLETGQTFLSVHEADLYGCFGDDVLYDISTATQRFVFRKPGVCPG